MKKIGFVGAGSMAEAMINGILQSGITKPEHIYITNRSNDERLIELKETYGVRPCRDKNEFFTHTDIIILAFKPKDAAESIDSIRPYITPACHFSTCRPYHRNHSALFWQKAPGHSRHAEYISGNQKISNRIFRKR